MGRTQEQVYIGKAIAALVDHISEGRIASKETVVFVRTGGFPALFAYGHELCDALDLAVRLKTDL